MWLAFTTRVQCDSLVHFLYLHLKMNLMYKRAGLPNYVYYFEPLLSRLPVLLLYIENMTPMAYDFCQEKKKLQFTWLHSEH